MPVLSEPAVKGSLPLTGNRTPPGPGPFTKLSSSDTWFCQSSNENALCPVAECKNIMILLANLFGQWLWIVLSANLVAQFFQVC